MFIVFLGFIANQFAASALLFLIIWLIMRKRGGVKLGVRWLLSGIIATVFIGGLARFLFWMISGEKAGAPLTGNAGPFFFILLPIFTAIGLCAYFRWQIRSKSYVMLNHENKTDGNT